MNNIDIKTFNSNNIQLLLYSNNDDFYTIYLDFNTYPIKIITDFNNYCYADSIIDICGLDKFNLFISFNNKNISNIIKQLNQCILFDNIKAEINNPFHINQKKNDKYDKTNINYLELYNLFLDNIDTKIKNNNRLLLSPEQILKLLINEIKKINSNREYKHYITIDNTNLFSLIVNLELDDKIIELRLIIDPYFYPVIPPKIDYVKPKIKLDLLYSINNLDILMLKNWCVSINLEYLITNLAEQLQPIIKEYIIEDIIDNDELKYELIKLSSLTNNNNQDNKIKFNIPIPKQNKIIQVSKYWKSGTGYGTSPDVFNGWSIEKYIQEKDIERNNILKCLVKINSLINEYTIINDQNLELYMINQIKGLTMLELNKSKELYYEIFNILNKIINYGYKLNLNDIYNNIKIIYEETIQLFEINKELQTDDLLKTIIFTFDIINSKVNFEPNNQIISQDYKEKYCQIMKSLQFGNYEIPNYHNYVKKTDKINQTAIIRVLSEISNFKSSLPLNWESSIWTRVSKTNFNIFSFLISGPKDTPYENGLFEFHAYFPIDYPNIVPEVIIHTTDNGKVRFNPNLYANGKVCLSLLGTWSGQESEKWNAKTSTFLQVMVSIQSLILVDQPYFNEPGWEKDINTPKGKINSDNYNQNLHPNTIKLGIINMIKNPPTGFEEVVKNHFTMKKEEILNTICMWEEKATVHKETITNYRKELIDLLNK